MSSTAGTAAPSPGRIFFDAVLHPHRSLDPRAFRLLMAAAALMMLGIGTVFLLLGAWPVLGFCGLELLLLYVMFRLNFRSARSFETVRLSEPAGLEVRRFSPRGEIGAWRFEPTWLRVDMDNPPTPESRLTLASHGRRLAIGGFLTPEERLEVATALKSALQTYRSRPPAPA